MISFNEYMLLEAELSTFALSEAEFLSNANGFLMEDAKVVTPGRDTWNKMREGAHAYFSASPEQQKKMVSDAYVLKQKFDKNKGKTDLFTDEAGNPKLAASAKNIPEFKTKGLALAPSTASGIDVCPAATPECKSSCLGEHAGRGAFDPQVKGTRRARTKFMFAHPAHFYAMVDHEVQKAKESAHGEGKKLAVRLNVLSDIPHERLAPQLFKKHSDVHFYDYTKLSGRPMHKDMPPNYHLTVSSTGINHAGSNWSAVQRHLDRGGVASMVFALKAKRGEPGGKGYRAGGDLPTHVVVHDHTGKEVKRYRVIDGDVHDHRHLDHDYSEAPKSEGLIAGLRLKAQNHERSLKNAGKFAVSVGDDGLAHVHPSATHKLSDLG